MIAEINRRDAETQSGPSKDALICEMLAAFSELGEGMVYSAASQTTVGARFHAEQFTAKAQALGINIPGGKGV